MDKWERLYENRYPLVNLRTYYKRNPLSYLSLRKVITLEAIWLLALANKSRQKKSAIEFLLINRTLVDPKIRAPR